MYDSLSTESLVVVMGDLNADMGNAIGDKSAREPSWHGEKLLEFVHYFNLFPVNLFQNCIGPLDTFFSTCGCFRSTIDYILLPNCWFEKTSNAKTFCLSVDNTSGGGGNSHILGYGMCHFLRVLFWLENKFLGLFCSL